MNVFVHHSPIGLISPMVQQLKAPDNLRLDEVLKYGHPPLQFRPLRDRATQGLGNATAQLCRTSRLAHPHLCSELSLMALLSRRVRTAEEERQEEKIM